MKVTDRLRGSTDTRISACEKADPTRRTCGCSTPRGSIGARRSTMLSVSSLRQRSCFELLHPGRRCCGFSGQCGLPATLGCHARCSQGHPWVLPDGACSNRLSGGQIQIRQDCRFRPCHFSSCHRRTGFSDATARERLVSRPAQVLAASSLQNLELSFISAIEAADGSHSTSRPALQ